MKGYVCLLLLLFSGLASAQAPATSEESAVLQVQQRWLEASQKGDDAVLQQIIDDRFVGSTPNDRVVERNELFPPAGSPPVFTSTHFADLNASVIGNTAVVFGKMVTTGTHPETLRCAMFYMKHGGSWKMIAAHLVPVTPEREPAGQ